MRAHRRKVFSIGPGDPRAGVADCPAEVHGVAVRAFILVRADRPGALVRLVDERFAMTGKVTAIGSAADLGTHARRRAFRCPSIAEQRWLRACAKHLAAGSLDHTADPAATTSTPLT